MVTRSLGPPNDISRDAVVFATRPRAAVVCGVWLDLTYVVVYILSYTTDVRPAPGRRRSPRRGVCQAAPPPAAAESFAAEHGAEAVLVSTHNGMALTYARQLRRALQERSNRFLCYALHAPCTGRIERFCNQSSR